MVSGCFIVRRLGANNHCLLQLSRYTSAVTSGEVADRENEMNKTNRSESAHAMYYVSIGEFGLAARTMSACIRAVSKKDANELITMAAAYPALVQHPDFIVQKVSI